MEIPEMIQSMIERAGVKTIYGEPIVAGNKTIVPVAKVSYGFGGGAGRKQTERAEEGSGGGGGFRGSPAGVVEVTNEATRFIPIGNKRKIAAALLVGLAIGWQLGMETTWKRPAKRWRLWNR